MGTHHFGSVCVLYQSLLSFFAYMMCKLAILQKRSERNPPFGERIVGYLGCIAAAAVVAFIAFFFSHFDYNRGATVFLALLIPVLFGAADGYKTTERLPPSSAGDDEW